MAENFLLRRDRRGIDVFDSFVLAGAAGRSFGRRLGFGFVRGFEWRREELEFSAFKCAVEFAGIDVVRS
jgi:hypothetical protein